MIWLKTRCFFFFDFLRTIWKYYRNPLFAKVHLYFTLQYFLKNPFRISRKFLQERGDEDIYAYGETPLSTLDEISKKCGITKDDIVFELGCGRGATCFWLNTWLGCEVVGIEYIPEFVEIAQTIVQKFHLKGIRFRLENFLETDFTGATVIYLYGTCLDDPSIQMLAESFRKCPPGTKIITTSYPIPGLPVQKSFKARFPWGRAEIYWHTV